MTQKHFIPALRYNWLTRLYDPILHLTMPERKFKADLLASAGIAAADRVLDFGCGSLTLSIMGQRQFPHTDFFAIDVDEKILAIARKKARSENMDIQIDHYDGIQLPYQDNLFDHVISSLVFHHLTPQQKSSALTELNRVLKPGGKIHICDFGYPSNKVQRVAFYIIQNLDGFKTTTGNVQGVIPRLMTQSKFTNVRERGIFKTAVGTVRTVSGQKQPTIQ